MVNKSVVLQRALDHEWDMKNAGIIYKSNSKSIRWVLESSLLQKTLNFNLSDGNYSVDPVTLKAEVPPNFDTHRFNRQANR